jgi:TerB-C domain
MFRDLVIGGVLGVALWGWRAYRSTIAPTIDVSDNDRLSPQNENLPAVEIKTLQKQLAKTKKELAIALAKRAEAETQVSELNQLATDRAIELVQLQADSADLLAQVEKLSQKRPRKKRVPKVDVELQPEQPEEIAPDLSELDSSESQVSEPKVSEPLALDLSLIGQKQAETAAAAQLLQPIFTEETPTEATLGKNSSQSGAIATLPTLDLDEAHTSFLRILSQQSSWNRQDLVKVAQNNGLLLDGVLEVINEAAIERCDDALTEGDDPIELNSDVLQELLS